MGKYRCIKKEVWFAGYMWKRGDGVECDEPRDGKGNSLVHCQRPAFEEIEADAPIAKPDPTPPAHVSTISTPDEKAMDEDPREPAEIRAALMEKFEYRAAPNAKKSTLIAKERELTALMAKDAAMDNAE